MSCPDTLRFDMIDHVMLVAHADVPPSPEEWARLKLVREANAPRLRGSLVVAPPRATLTASQRADVVSFTKQASIAVITDSAMVRGMATAVGLLGIKVKAFAPSDLERALTYLELAPRRHEEVRRRIAIFNAQLSAGGPPALSAR